MELDVVELELVDDDELEELAAPALNVAIQPPATLAVVQDIVVSCAPVEDTTFDAAYRLDVSVLYSSVNELLNDWLVVVLPVLKAAIHSSLSAVVASVVPDDRDVTALPDVGVLAVLSSSETSDHSNIVR